jgi:hypothetical protein
MSSARNDRSVHHPLVIENRVDGFSFYESPAAVTAHLEEWYVDEEQWRAWDASGRRLTLVLEDRLVVPRLLETEPAHLSELREALGAWLAKSGRPATGPAADLIEAGIALEGLLRDPTPFREWLRARLRRSQ